MPEPQRPVQRAPAAFISYCRADQEFVLRLAKDLKAAGATVWLDQLDIAPGKTWDNAIEDALVAAPQMLVILSPASVGSPNVRDEISRALRQGKIIIPVLYRDCDPPLRLERNQQIDLRSDYARGLARLLVHLGVADPDQSVLDHAAEGDAMRQTAWQARNAEAERLRHAPGQEEQGTERQTPEQLPRLERQKEGPEAQPVNTPSADVPPMENAAAPILAPFNQLQTRLTSFTSRIDYVYSVLIALLPLLLAFKFHVALPHGKLSYPTAAGPRYQEFTGYLWCYNWSSLVVTLPLALYLVRSTARRLFDLDRNPDKRIGIPNLLRSQQAAEAFRNLACDGRNLVAALFLTILIHVYDMHDEVACAWNVYRRSAPYFLPPQPPHTWDWSSFFLTNPSDRTLLHEGIALLLAAYLVQFLIVLTEISLIILLVRHNVGFLSSIYRRSRDGADTGSHLVLDLYDTKQRFGLDALQPQFNSQIRLLSLAAALAILSRIHNADGAMVHSFIATLSSPQDWGVAPGQLGAAWNQLFPTFGQTLFVVFWIAMFLIVFSPALAKLMPLRSFRDRNPSPQEFLLELIPPGSEIDVETEGLTRHKSLEKTEKKFVDGSFWPSGNRHAQYLSIFAFFVFFILIAPIRPQHPYFQHAIYFSLLAAFSYFGSKLLFYAFKYRLGVVGFRHSRR